MNTQNCAARAALVLALSSLLPGCFGTEADVVATGEAPEDRNSDHEHDHPAGSVYVSHGIVPLAEGGTIALKVIDATSLAPLAGVSACAIDPAISCGATDAQGRAEFHGTAGEPNLIALYGESAYVTTSLAVTLDGDSIDLSSLGIELHTEESLSRLYATANAVRDPSRATVAVFAGDSAADRISIQSGDGVVSPTLSVAAAAPTQGSLLYFLNVVPAIYVLRVEGDAAYAVEPNAMWTDPEGTDRTVWAGAGGVTYAGYVSN